MEKKDIRSLDWQEMQDAAESMGEKKFRAAQIYQWLHVKLVRSFDEMTDLSKAFREKLEQQFTLTALKDVEIQESAVDGTKKFLFELDDGNVVESVWMKYKFGNSVCISSQVGCRMGCKFCASTLDGLVRSLTPAEMLEQVYAVTRLTEERVSHVVVMGTGEPLDNYDALVKFIHILTDDHGLHISQRDVTVSTCGLVPQMLRLAEENLQITLALSLHAPEDNKRKELMPIADRYSVKELMDACGYYFEKTGRRITFEYSLVKGFNDTPEDARSLIRLVKSMNCHVNLIPVNPVKECGYSATDRGQALAFQKELEKNRIHVTIRREMGRDIDGACGQLRRRHISDPNVPDAADRTCEQEEM